MKTILIPLDGSEHSDRVLWEVKRLLLREEMEVVLLRVVEPFRTANAERRDKEPTHIGLRLDAARRHVTKLATELQNQGVVVSSLVLIGNPTAVILRRAETLGASLVAMATHGRSGPSRWVRGSVAERVLQRCPAPLLLVNPSKAEDAVRGIRFRKVLVPLDGSDWSASVLQLVDAFAETYDAEIVLMRVAWAPQAVMGEYPVTPTLLPPTPEEIEETLGPFREKLVQAGRTVSVKVGFGDPADEILAAVESEEIDLVAMTTHGRSGVDRWTFGSVAEKVVRNCPCPLLLERVAAFPGEDEKEDGEEEASQSTDVTLLSV